MSTVSIEKGRFMAMANGQDYALPVVAATNTADQPDAPIIYVPGIGEIGNSLETIVGHISEATSRNVVGFNSRLSKILRNPLKQGGSVPGELFEQVADQLAPGIQLDVVGASLAGLIIGSVFDRNNSGIRKAALVSPVMVSPHATASPELLDFAENHTLSEQLESLRKIEPSGLSKTVKYAARFAIFGGFAEFKAAIHNRELGNYPSTIANNTIDIAPGALRAEAAFRTIGTGTIVPQLIKASKNGVLLNFVIGIDDKPHKLNEFIEALSSDELTDRLTIITDRGATNHTPLSTVGGMVQLDAAIDVAELRITAQSTNF